MKRFDHEKVIEIFNDALELSGAKRPHFLANACEDDAELLEEVKSLLASHDESFLEQDVSSKVLALFRGRLTPGDVVKQYEIIEMIGKGGMGEVYLALDTRLNRLIALKLLGEDFIQDPKKVKAFEAQVASRISHPNILTVHDFNTEGNYSFIVTEYVEGDTLRNMLRSGPMSVAKALSITAQISSALEAAHSRDVVHGDIKPENIIVRSGAEVKVLDFGIAKLVERPDLENKLNSTESSRGRRISGFGTANYMSPEQVRGRDVDARTDIWSLGVCLYEMLAGKRPFGGETQVDIFASILKDEPAPPGQHIPESLKTVVNTALQKNREQRYQTINEFNAHLERSLSAPNLGADTFGAWTKTSGFPIWIALIICAASSFLLSAVFALAIYSDFIHIEPSTQTIEAADTTQSKLISVADAIGVITAARSAQAIGSIFHLIGIGITFICLRKYRGPQGFRHLKYDKQNGSLKANIIYSTGYEKVSDWRRARGIAKSALRYYRWAFVALLVAWVFLYSCALINLGDYQGKNFIVASLFTLANNLNTLFIWLCFDTLNEPITTGDRTQNKKKIVIKENRKWPLSLILTPAVLILWLTLELWLTYESSSGASPRAELVHYFSKVLSGIAGGVAMALFVGRFQSKFLKSPAWLVIVLFFYTVLQVLFIFYGGKSPGEVAGAAIVMNVALALKCLLILYMLWLFHSGRLLFYLVRVRRAAKQIDKEWLNFREVLQQESGSS